MFSNGDTLKTALNAPRIAQNRRTDKLYLKLKNEQEDKMKEKEKMEKREECLRTACEIVNGARQECYGEAEDNFQTIATLWESYLKATGCDVMIDSKDVAMMMILLKVARAAAPGIHLDNYVDISGYAACAYGIDGMCKVDD